MSRINRDYYIENDTLWLARDLLGKYLYCHSDQYGPGGGIITETEAYLGANDRASHAYGNRRTQRTETMFKTGGIAYVYLCYGIHHLFNIVTAAEDIPHAVLVRGILPMAGNINMERRTGRKVPFLLDGPGKLTRAMGITTHLNGAALDQDTIWLEDKSIQVPDAVISATPRIGVDYAGEDAKLPYRFVLDDKPFLMQLA
ncbi:MAG: DNA-3-methyladenine glycosylase [Bacteroidetes bacterium]|nr:MAG: DNA-3-methyladenine glycosylase [Bacteroidota bacterium]